MKKNYSLHFNEKRQVWIANVRKPTGGWLKKWLPNSFNKFQHVDAEAWLIGWLGNYYSSWNSNIQDVVEPKKTLAVLFPKWMELREKSVGTKFNTYNGFKMARNWILDTDGFTHLSIQDLDIEKDLARVEVIRNWLNSVEGMPRTKLAIASTLSIFLDEAVAEGWIGEDFVSPFIKIPIKRMLRDLSLLAKRGKKPVTISMETVEKLLSSHKVIDFRKVRYLLAMATGLRVAELQALQWKDLFLDEPIPYLTVEKQLYKRGSLPLVNYEELLAQGKSKQQIFKTNSAVVGAPKRDSHRTIPLHPKAVEALRFWKTKGFQIFVGRKPQAEDPVFARSKASCKPGEEAGSFTMVDKSCLYLDLLRVGVDRNSITMHAFRRSFATYLDAQGVESSHIDRMMGHSSKRVAERNYINRSLNTLYDSVCKLELPDVVFGRGATKGLAAG